MHCELIWLSLALWLRWATKGSRDWNRFVASPRPSVDSCGRELKGVRPARRINDRFFTRAPELIRHLLGTFSNGIGSLYATGRTRSWSKAAKTANLGRA